MDKKQRKQFITSLVMAILLPVLLILVFRNQYHEIMANIRTIPIVALLGLLGVGILSTFMESAANMTLIRSQLKHFSFRQAVNVTFLGIFSNLATFGFGTVPLQSWYLHSCGLMAGIGASTMTLSYTFYKTSILIYTTVMLLLQGQWMSGQNAELNHYLILGYGVCALIIAVLLLVITWKPIQNLACKLIDYLPKNGKWNARKEIWKQNLEELHKQSVRLLSDRKRLAAVLGWNCLRLTFLYLCLYLSIRFIAGPIFSIWQVLLLGGMMQIIISAIPNIAGMGPAEFAFLLIFSSYMNEGQLSSALILYRIATYFFPFIISILVFLLVQRNAGKKTET